MTKALKIVSQYDFTAPSDDSDDKTVWKLRGLNGLEWIECTQTGKTDVVKVITKGIAGWSNFKDDEGNEIPYSIGNMGRIPPDILIDIYLSVNQSTTIGDQERKN